MTRIERMLSAKRKEVRKARWKNVVNSIECLFWLRMVFMPSYWLPMRKMYSKTHDTYVNSLIVKKIAPDKLNLWLHNYPYAYGHKYIVRVSEGGYRPSRKTIYRLHKYIEGYKCTT